MKKGKYCFKYGGLTDEEDIFAPVLPIRRRAIWFSINLITALTASGLLVYFKIIEKVVALAVLLQQAWVGLGSQTLTLVIKIALETLALLIQNLC